MSSEGTVTLPTKLSIDEKVVDIAPGVFAVALTEEGNIYTWGVDNFGNDGGEGRTYQAKPHLISMPENITKIYNGHGAVGLAKDVSNNLYIWGWNYQGLLANGKTENSMTPQKLEIPSEVLDISCYSTHLIALCKNGKVYTWGSNDYGEQGNGVELDLITDGDATPSARLYPGEVKIDDKIVAVAAGNYVSYALAEDGDLYAWGSNFVGELGIGDKEKKYSSVPVRVNISGKVKAIAVGQSLAYAIMEDKTVYGWGYNNNSKETNKSSLGINSNKEIIYTPVIIPINNKVKSISTGKGHAFAFAEDGSIWAWGSNKSNKISQDLPEYVNTPTLLDIKVEK